MFSDEFLVDASLSTGPPPTAKPAARIEGTDIAAEIPVPAAESATGDHTGPALPPIQGEAVEAVGDLAFPELAMPANVRARPGWATRTGTASVSAASAAARSLVRSILPVAGNMATQGVRAGLANPDRRIAAALSAAGETMVEDVPKALRTAGGVAAVAFRGALFPDEAVEEDAQ